MAKKEIKNSRKLQIRIAAQKGDGESLYLGNLRDGSHLQNQEEPLVIGEDALDFEGGGTDEFLSKEKNSSDVEAVKKKGGRVC